MSGAGGKKGALPAGPGAALLREVLGEAGIEAPKGAVEGLAAHAAEMLRWNRSIRLTAIVDPVEVAVKHIVDSLALLRFAPFPGRLLDFGSGAGYPGIPLALYLPGTRVVLLEASEKKCAFLSRSAGCCTWRTCGSSMGEPRIGRRCRSGGSTTSSRAPRPGRTRPYRSFRRTLPDGGRMLFMAGPGGIPAAEVPGTVTRVERFRLPRGMGEREIVEVSLPEKD